MITQESLLRITIRAILIATTIGVASAILLLQLAWNYNPQDTFHGPDGIAWISLTTLGVIAFILGGGVSLTIYMALKLLVGVLRSFTSDT